LLQAESARAVDDRGRHTRQYANMPVNKLLLVEDEAIIAMGQESLLSRFGYQVTIAHSGERALEIFRDDSSIELVLMDIDLGTGIDGTEAASRMLAERDIPVVFLSSHTEPAIVEKTERITSYGYIPKNSSSTVIDASIKMAFKLFESKSRTQKTNTKLEAMLDALPDLFFEVGLDGLYIDAHCPDASLLVEPLARMLGHRIPELLPADVSQIVMGAIEEAHRNGISRVKRYQLAVPAGMRWFEISVSAMSSQLDEPRFILICRDITDSVHAAEQLDESRRHAERLLNVAAEIIMATDIDGAITLLNDSGHRLLGYEPGALIGRNWAETCLPEEIRPDIKRFLEDLVRDEATTLVPHENPVLCRDGSRRLILWHNTVLEDGSGAVVGILSSGEDITEYKELEDRLRSSEDLYRGIIQASPDNISVTDMQGRIVMSSDKAFPMFGYDPEDQYIGRPVTDFVAPEDRDRVIGNMMRMLAGEMLGAECYLGLRKDGTTFDIEINGTFILDSRGVPQQMLFIVRDISARR